MRWNEPNERDDALGVGGRRGSGESREWKRRRRKNRGNGKEDRCGQDRQGQSERGKRRTCTIAECPAAPLTGRDASMVGPSGKRENGLAWGRKQPKSPRPRRLVGHAMHAGSIPIAPIVRPWSSAQCLFFRSVPVALWHN